MLKTLGSLNRNGNLYKYDIPTNVKRYLYYDNKYKRQETCCVPDNFVKSKYNNCYITNTLYPTSYFNRMGESFYLPFSTCEPHSTMRFIEYSGTTHNNNKTNEATCTHP